MRAGASVFPLPGASERIIKLQDRNINMLKKELILRNPLRHLGFETEDILPAWGFGAVLAYAGVGKVDPLQDLP